MRTLPEIPATTHEAALFIGRFQPLHNGHLVLLRQALATAPRVIVVLGSSFQARTPKNPFTWEERAELIRLAVGEADAVRIQFLPLRDFYDETRWVAAVKAGVARLLATAEDRKAPSIALIGHFKDATSSYLRRFEPWQLIAAERAPGTPDAQQVRDALFASAELASADDRRAALGALTAVLPHSTLAFLRSWISLPFFNALAAEWAALKRYHEAWSQAPYAPVFVTVDAVVQCAEHVLLIRRAHPPGVGLWAVPGGFIEQRETAYQSTLRELAEETHLHLLDTTMQQALKASAVFDHPDRSQRGRTITHAHHFDLGDRELPEVCADDDAQSVAWVPIADLTSMEDQFHDDHFHMLDHFLGLTKGE